MRKRLLCKISVFVLLAAFSGLHFNKAFALTPSPGYNSKATMLSRVDLRKYFEKAMSLFENGKYKEAIAVFENLMEIEKSQNESYFTPFAEIYIEKSNDRLKQKLVLNNRRWARMKQDVINEAERIAQEEARENAKKTKGEEERLKREEELRMEPIKDRERKNALEEEERIQSSYEKAVGYYNNQNYPAAIVEFKKLKELAPDSRFVNQADSFIEKAQGEIKKKEERELLARMEAARRASLDMEREKRRKALEAEEKRREKERLEAKKARLRKIFEARLKDRIVRERIARIDSLMNDIRKKTEENELEDAEKLVAQAMEEFPENERFKDIAHYVELQKVHLEEKALRRAREITEEKMLLEVAKKHLLPEVKTGELKKEKKITPLVRIPEIRKRLKIPISVDFKDVELDYVLGFLSDATGVNMIASSEIDMTEKKVTMRIKDMPLEDALRYILKSQDLVYRIEEDAVWVVTKKELDNEKVETRVYFLNQGIGRFAEFSTSSDSDSSSSEVKTVKDILENAVDWPKDSKLTLDDRTGALIISNTPSNLETAENLLYTLDVTPVQVMIEARFLEVKVTDVDELGIEWKLNSDWGVKQNNAKQNIHGFASGSGSDFSDFTRASEGFNLTYQGILSHPQFQAVIHALNEKQNVKTLSSPRITTLNNQSATIEVIDEYIYPTRYEVSLVQFDINGDGDFDDAGETEWANIPQDFVTRNVGILLHVKPSVGVDNNTITLALTPEVSEAAGSYAYSGDVSIPQFQTRNLSTSVIIGSGETVMLGGLIKETNTNIKTKVPLLGDLPIVGGLFRKNTDNTERRNLLIFVTATVLNKEDSVMASMPGASQTDQVREQ
ncbi:MAG: hypothetical protein KKC66_05090 [Candidatus Omnitrophica bacterium]|nr:hypothetical protein [Candidatus Omnitrophota bacterium]